MQLSDTAFNRDQRHDQISNSNRLSRNKVNLVEMHDKRATFIEDNIKTDWRVMNRQTCDETGRMDICNEVAAERCQESSVVRLSQTSREVKTALYRRIHDPSISIQNSFRCS